MMSRIHLPFRRARNVRQNGSRLDLNLVSGQTAVRRPDPVLIRRRKVLNQRPAQMHVQHLHAPADRKGRQIPRERFIDQSPLSRIPFLIRLVCLGPRNFTVQRRIHIGPASQQKALATADLSTRVRFRKHRFDTDKPQRRGIALRIRTLTISNHHTHSRYYSSARSPR